MRVEQEGQYCQSSVSAGMTFPPQFGQEMAAVCDSAGLSSVGNPEAATAKGLMLRLTPYSACR